MIKDSHHRLMGMESNHHIIPNPCQELVRLCEMHAAAAIPHDGTSRIMNHG